MCKNELNDLLKQEKLVGATLLIFYNKSDLKGSMSLNEVKNFLGLDNIKVNDYFIDAGISRKYLNDYSSLFWKIKQLLATTKIFPKYISLFSLTT